jgi:signal peptidase I
MNPIRKIILIPFSFTSVFLLINRLTWLFTGLILISLFLYLIKSKTQILIYLKKHTWSSYLFFFLAILSFSIAFRVFLIEIYSIPSHSMEETIINGDKVMMSKLSYGPRMPASPFEIPWLSIALYLNKKQRSKADSVWWQYKRLNGFSEVKHNQVVVFNSPKNPKKFMIKRCMGLPGDTLLIKDEKVFANYKEIPGKGTIKLISRIIFNNYTMASSLSDSMGLEIYSNCLDGGNHLSTFLTNDQAKTLLKYSCIDSIVIEKNRPDSAYTTFPGNDRFLWSIDNFGPLVIPAKGMTISLNEENYILYRKIIYLYENTHITTSNEVYFLNGVKAKTFTFKNNYYFMLGDNRHDSNDSRYWGFVPEQYIIGKAVLVLFSFRDHEFKWNRILHVIQ